jgi:hypothetical protein
MRKQMKQLDDLQMTDLWPKVHERTPGPLTEPVPRRREGSRLVAGVVAFAVFAGAAYFTWTAFGPDIAAGPSGENPTSVASSPTPTPAPPDAVYPPPYFYPDAEGWYLHHSPASPAGNGMIAWASTVPFEPDDLSPQAPAIPTVTLTKMPPGSVVIVAQVVAHGGEVTIPWPKGSEEPLRLSDADIRGPVAEEPSVPMTVYDLETSYVSVRTYFAGDSPSGSLISQSQSELDTLQLPPACPVPASPDDAHWYQFGLSETSGPPGTSVDVTGYLGFDLPDGTYEHDPTTIELWWDADPDAWPSLLSDNPDGELLAEGEQSGCAVDLTFVVPTSALMGHHSVVALATDQSRSGATKFGSGSFEVTP